MGIGRARSDHRADRAARARASSVLDCIQCVFGRRSSLGRPRPPFSVCVGAKRRLGFDYLNIHILNRNLIAIGWPSACSIGTPLIEKDTSCPLEAGGASTGPVTYALIKSIILSELKRYECPEND
ncbi:hypothetical protein EVAR_28075_1 [Eumeta japonica]|uniref:Uncharacterized protein n=1 Tax=Eumeta variegata TaxID=151549 RepID=A0A4C1W9G2_EUMVA|nr:hypothetical protein EVAR_28075_1 [Eumeta japonica]